MYIRGGFKEIGAVGKSEDVAAQKALARALFLFDSMIKTQQSFGSSRMRDGRHNTLSMHHEL
jgi:hypothetical protein